MGQLVLLSEWAAGPNGFRHPPKTATLNRIAKTRQTFPAAVKVGHRWMIDEEARFIGLVGKTEISSNLSPEARRLVERGVKGGETTYS